MDMMSYVDGKAAGTVQLTKVGFETYQMVARKFDAATGRETYPELVTLNRKTVDDAQKQAAQGLVDAQKRVDGISQLVKDLDALDAA